MELGLDTNEFVRQIQSLTNSYTVPVRYNPKKVLIEWESKAITLGQNMTPFNLTTFVYDANRSSDVLCLPELRVYHDDFQQTSQVLMLYMSHSVKGFQYYDPPLSVINNLIRFQIMNAEGFE